jgi:hypothetical protein
MPHAMRQKRTFARRGHRAWAVVCSVPTHLGH